MLNNDNQREQSNMASEYGLKKAFCLLLFIYILSFSSSSIGGTPEINKVTTPATVTDVVYVSPFTLKEGFQYDWRQEQPFIKSGTLVIFIVNPDLVIPRNAAEPVLYVGKQTAQRLNFGNESGHVIAIVPEAVDLAREPAWFGSPELPERVNAEIINLERANADKAGIRPFTVERVQSVTQKTVEANDLAALLREHASELLMKYSPQEKALAETWRLPVSQR